MTKEESGVLSSVRTVSKEMDNTGPTETRKRTETPGPKQMALQLFLHLVLSTDHFLIISFDKHFSLWLASLKEGKIFFNQEQELWL